MTPEQQAAFRKLFFRKLTLDALEPDDPRYVSLYETPELAKDDPVELLRFAVEVNPAPTVQLLSGFRGTGKSTELRRLRKVLRQEGHVVLLFDIEDYINTAMAVDPVDFFFAFAVAFATQVATTTAEGDPLREDVLTRLKNFFSRTEVEFPELSFGAKATGDVGVLKTDLSSGLKVVLRDNPSFREKARKHWSASLGSLVEDVHEFVELVTRKLLESLAPEKQVVVLVDSIEHIRAGSKDADVVQSSVERLFTAHAEALHFPGVHVVYTVHPYMKIKYANLGDLYEPGGVQLVPTLKVRERPDGDVADGVGAPRKVALEALEQVVAARGDWWNLLGSGKEGRERLERLILASGGHLRDLMRLLTEITRRARVIPVTEEIFTSAVEHVRNEALPIADDDALWLAEIAASRKTCLPSQDKLPALARFLDTHQVLCYRNGTEWFDVHPLIRDVVLEQAAFVRERAAKLAAPQAE